MSEAFTREYILDNAARWQAAQTFIGGNWEGFNAKDNPLRMILTTAEATRNAEQNKYYFKAVIEQIVDQVWVNGQKFDKKTWHEYYAEKFGILEEIRMPDGSLRTRRKSTMEYKVREFSEYTMKVEADAASEFGVRFIVREV